LIQLAAICSEEAYQAIEGTITDPNSALKRIKISRRDAGEYGLIVVVAVSGTQGLKDWLLNFRHSASQPNGVLVCAHIKVVTHAIADDNQDETWNLCHTGYLEAVRLLITPLASSLSAMERGSTLLFTGHSAGAAIASLLYAHITTTKVSPLAKVAEMFECLHCIVFGAPPISIAPLQESRLPVSKPKHSLFLSLINEGDPITRADIGYLTHKYRWLAPIPSRLFFEREPCFDDRVGQGSDIIAKSPIRHFVNSGTLFSMQSDVTDVKTISIRRIHNHDLDGAAILTWSEHGIKVYRERIASILAKSNKFKTKVNEVGPSFTMPKEDPYMEEIVPNEWITYLFS
jgi:hypothetical protein